MDITKITETAAQLGYTITIDEGKIDYIFPTRPATPGERHYTPELYRPRNNFGKSVGWTIQTVSYGSMESDEVDLVIDGLKRAQQMVTFLENFGEGCGGNCSWDCGWNCGI